MQAALLRIGYILQIAIQYIILLVLIDIIEAMTELLNKHIKLFGGSSIAVLSIAVAVFIGWQGVMAVPIQIGSVVEGLGISEQRSGLLGTAEITTIALVTMLLASKIGEWSKPRVALCGMVFVVTGQLLSAFAPGFALLFACRLLVGVGAGLTYGAACSCIAGHDSGDRIFAWGLAFAQLLLASMLYGLPFSSAFNFHEGVFLTLALLALVCAPLLIKLPDGRQTVPDVREPEQEIAVSLSMIFWFFLALTLFNVAIGMLWSFVERRTIELNMDASHTFEGAQEHVDERDVDDRRYGQGQRSEPPSPEAASPTGRSCAASTTRPGAPPRSSHWTVPDDS